MEVAGNEDQSSVLVNQICFEQPLPSPGCHGHRGKPGRHEEEKENRRGLLAKSHVLKHFMSPTISASMKITSPTPKSESVLVERSEADKKTPLLQESEFHCLDFETATTPLSAKGSEFEVQDCSAAPPPYDPFVNYLSPRPRFLRYNPSRRLEVLRRMQSHVGEEDGVEESLVSEKKSVEEMESSSSQVDGSSSMERSDSISCQSEVSGDQTVQEAIGLPCSTIESKDADDKVSDDQIAPQEVETPLLVGVEEPTSQESGVEGLELEEEDEDEEEERSWWRPSSVLKSLLVLSLLILAPFYVSYVCSTSGVTFGDGGVGGGLLEIHDPLPHPSRFSFEKLIGNNQFSSPFFGVGVTSSSRFVNSSTDMFDAPNLGLEEMEASFYLKDAAYDANTFGDGGVGGGLLEIHDPLPHPSRFSFEKLIGNNQFSSSFFGVGVTSSSRFVNSSTDMFDAPNFGLEEMEASFYLKDAAYDANTFLEEENFLVKSDLSLRGLLDMEEEMLATQQTVVENVEELPDIMEADEKQYSEVQEFTTGVGSYDDAPKIEVPFFEEPGQFEMVFPSVTQGSIDSIDEQPLSEKLSLSDIVSLSMEPMCNTYGITSYYGTSMRLEENGNHLFPLTARNYYPFLSSVQTAVLMLAAILSSFLCLKCMKGRNSSSPSISNASTIGRGSSSTLSSTRKTQTPKYQVSSSTLSSKRKNSRRLSRASSNNQDRRLSSSLSTANSSSYGSITIHKEVVLKQEVVSTPVRRSSRLLNRTPPPYLL